MLIFGFCVLSFMDIMTIVTGEPLYMVYVAHISSIVFSYKFFRRGTGENWEYFWKYRKGTPVYVGYMNHSIDQWIQENIHKHDYYMASIGVYVFKEKSMASMVRLMVPR